LHKFKGLSRMLDVQWLFLWKLIVPLPQKVMSFTFAAALKASERGILKEL